LVAAKDKVFFSSPKHCAWLWAHPVSCAVSTGDFFSVGVKASRACS